MSLMNIKNSLPLSSKIVLGLLVTIIIVGSMAGYYFNKRAKETDTSKLIGFWMPDFPAPADQSGYYFLDDGRYLYKRALMNGQGTYAGSSGAWKVEDEDLYINKNKEYYLSDNTISCTSFSLSSKIKIGRFNFGHTDYENVPITTLLITDDSGDHSRPYVFSGADYGKREQTDILDKRLNMDCE